MSSWKEIIPQVEKSIFGWFQTEFGGDLNKSAFIAEIDKNFDYVDEVGMWKFGFTFGNPLLDFEFNMDIPGGCGQHQFNAEFEGIYSTREIALEKIGRLMDILPIADGTIKYVDRIKPVSYPTIERAIIDRKEDLDLGGETRVWRILLPLVVLVNSTD